MNRRAVTEAISQIQAKGDVFTRQVIIEQRRVDDISAVSISLLFRNVDRRKPEELITCKIAISSSIVDK